MAFPTTPVLDTFDRADASTLGANWSGNLIKQYAGSTPDSAILSNQATGLVSNAPALHYTSTTYGPDCEVYISVPTLPPGDVSALYLRIAQPGTTTADGYELRADAIASEWTIYSVTNGVETPIGSAVSHAFAAGDKMGFSAVGSTLTGYRFTGGTWNQIIQRTDSTYLSAGLIGTYYSSGTVYKLDDFGGGTITSFLMAQGME